MSVALKLNQQTVLDAIKAIEAGGQVATRGKIHEWAAEHDRPLRVKTASAITKIRRRLARLGCLPGAPTKFSNRGISDHEVELMIFRRDVVHAKSLLSSMDREFSNNSQQNSISNQTAHAIMCSDEGRDLSPRKAARFILDVVLPVIDAPRKELQACR